MAIGQITVPSNSWFPSMNSFMSAVGTPLAAFGIFNQAISGYYGAQSRQLQLESQALSQQFRSQIADINANMIAMQSQEIMRASHHQAGQITLRSGLMQSTARARIAASGIKLGEGSAAEIIETSELMKELDLDTLDANTMRALKANDMRAFAARTGATMHRMSARNLYSSASTINPFMAGMTGLIGGTANYANLWLRDRTNRTRERNRTLDRMRAQGY